MKQAMALAMVLGLVAGAAMAQQSTRIRGEVQSYATPVLTVKAREGNVVKITLKEGFGVTGVAKADIADIKPNTFVGVASLKGSDGKAYALEVLVFPEAGRGSNEGHYAWDLKPDSMMTNATVATVTQAPKGRELKLHYTKNGPGGAGDVDIVVPPDAPIVTFAPATPDLLKAGSHVMVPATKGDDGSLTSARVLIGLNGLVPPM